MRFKYILEICVMEKDSKSEESLSEEGTLSEEKTASTSKSTLKRGTAFYGREGAFEAWDKDFPTSEKTFGGDYKVSLAGEEADKSPEMGDEAS